MNIQILSFDIGPIICSESLEMPKHMTSFRLLDLLGNLGSRMVILKIL